MSYSQVPTTNSEIITNPKFLRIILFNQIIFTKKAITNKQTRLLKLILIGLKMKIISFGIGCWTPASKM